MIQSRILHVSHMIVNSTPVIDITLKRFFVATGSLRGYDG